MWCEAQSAAVRMRVTFIIKSRSCSASCSVSFVCAQVSFNPMTNPTLEMNPFDCDMPTLEVWPDDAGANNYVSLKLDARVCAIVSYVFFLFALIIIAACVPSGRPTGVL